jgi:hypothetical protein
VTRNFLLLFSSPLGEVTVTKPVVAPLGTVVVISVLETTVNVAAVPLKLTAVVPVSFAPRILTVAYGIKRRLPEPSFRSWTIHFP